ncbi:MAG: methyltransferase domain-containing protein [Janthinobacterium lividum]
MKSAPANLPDTLVAAAAAPYRQAGRFAWHFARGKLAGDPVFAALLEHGLLCGRARILDIGCGQGLLAALLLAAGAAGAASTANAANAEKADLARPADTAAAAGEMDAAHPAAAGSHVLQGADALHAGASNGGPVALHKAPRPLAYHGIDSNGAEIGRALRALCAPRPSPPPPQSPFSLRFTSGDMRTTPFGNAEAILLLDVLHYIDHPAQDALLARARAALGLSGVLILRVGDAAGGWRFRYSVLVDRLVRLLRTGCAAPLYCRSVAEWQASLEALDLKVSRLPAAPGARFANTVLIATAGDDLRDNTSPGKD